MILVVILEGNGINRPNGIFNHFNHIDDENDKVITIIK